MSKLHAKPLAAAALALASLLAATPAAAQDSLPARAVTALGIAIASQGDAALAQIRQELKETLLERIRPYLPEITEVRPEPQPERADAGRQ